MLGLNHKHQSSCKDRGLCLFFHKNSASGFSVRPLPSSCQRAVWVEVQVMDTFTMTLLMQNFFLDLKIPKSP